LHAYGGNTYHLHLLPQMDLLLLLEIDFSSDLVGWSAHGRMTTVARLSL